MQQTSSLLNRGLGWLASALRLRWLAYTTIFLALALLRVELSHAYGLTFTEAWRHSFATGLANDLFIIALVELGVGVVALLSPTVSKWAWSFLAALLVVAALANVLYFKFFGSELPLWVLRSHVADVTVNVGSATDLGASAWVVGALALLFVGVVVTGVRRPSAPRWTPLAMAVAMTGLALGAKNVVRLPSVLPQDSGVLASQVMVEWTKQLVQGDVGASALGSDFDGSSATVLASYRDAGRDFYPEAEDPAWPLYAPLPVDARDTVRWRKRLGLPAEGPIHVHFMFVESWRSYEFLHPLIGERVFPHLKKLFDERGFFYSQAYTSSAEAGQTARGRFSTQCSMLPGIGGPAPTIDTPMLRLTCLPELLQNEGYETVWMSPYFKSFHNAFIFESVHGTARFLDAESFRARGVTEELGKWGLADAPFFREAARALEEIVAEKRPVFSSSINLSTHHPWSMTPEGPLDSELLALTHGESAQREYLSRLRYSQEAIAGFIEETLNAPGGDATLFVVLGDHSTGVLPAQELTPLQLEELIFRVPLALVTKNLVNPRRFDHPLHQMDVAPMVARVLGLQGETSWMGRETALDEAGSAFVFQTPLGVHFRAEDTVCYALDPSGPTCWRVPPGADPLFDELEDVPVDPEQVAYFQNVVGASRHAVWFGLLRPPEATQAAR